MEIPYICGEYTPLFRPEHQGNYVNDHCIVRHGDTYHLFGITSHTSSPTDERYFIHATGSSLTAPRRTARYLIKKGRGPMDIRVGDTLEMKKPHPCGGRRFAVLRIGMDFRLRCEGCGHEFMAPRLKMEKNIRRILREDGTERPITDR